MNGPADDIIDSIPANGIDQEIMVAASLDGLDPGSDRVGMKDETARGFADAPPAHSHELQDGQALGGGIIRPAVRRHSGALAAKNADLAPEQFDIAMGMIALDD